MNHRNQSPIHQRGMALILSLLILLVMVVLGVAAMSNVNMQERMAGNANQQALAFEAASAGVSNSINFVQHDPFSDFECGKTIHDPDSPVIVWGPTCWSDPDTGECMDSEIAGDGVHTRQRMYCLKHPDTARSQLFVLSRGEVITGGQGVAQRDIEVRLDIGQDGGTPMQDCRALCMPGGTPGDIGWANSRRFLVDGGIAVGNADLLDALNAAIEDRPRARFLPQNQDPVQYYPDLPSPWNSATTVMDFAMALRDLAEDAANGEWDHDEPCENCFFDDDYSSSGSPEFGTEGEPQVTFIDGNMNVGGSPTGNGILVVNGDMTWNGTPQFNGLVLVLGESFSVDGGGQGGVTGSLVLAPLDGSGNFGTLDLVLHEPGQPGAGGGGALYKHDCDELDKAKNAMLEFQAAIGNYNPALDSWIPGCDSEEENIFVPGPEELVIASWRENIGWREEFFGSD